VRSFEDCCIVSNDVVIVVVAGYEGDSQQGGWDGWQNAGWGMSNWTVPPPPPPSDPHVSWLHSLLTLSLVIIIIIIIVIITDTDVIITDTDVVITIWLFGIVYLISWLRRRLLITLEDCLIKLICLSLWCCNDCVCIVCFTYYLLFFSLCWAYISCWYSLLCPVITFIKLCLLDPYFHTWCGLCLVGSVSWQPLSHFPIGAARWVTVFKVFATVFFDSCASAVLNIGK